MKSLLRIFFLILLPGLLTAQGDKNYEESLLVALRNAANDTIRMEMNRNLGFYHQDSDPGKALGYHETQLVLAKKLNLKLWEADAYQQIAYCKTGIFKLPEAYENYMQALKIAEDPTTAKIGWGYSGFSNSKSPEEARLSIIGMIHFELYNFYYQTRYYEESFRHIKQALEIGESLQNKKILSLANRDIGSYYFNINMPDSAFVYYQKALKHYQNSPYQKNLGSIYMQIGLYYAQMQKYDSAKVNYHKGIALSLDPFSKGVLENIQRLLGYLFISTGQLDSALLYTSKANMLADSINDLPGKSISLRQLGTIYQLKKDYSAAYNYLERGSILSDSLSDYYIDRLMEFQNLSFDQKIKLQELEKEQQQAKSRNKMIALLTGLGIFLLAALLLLRNNRQKQKANKFLAETLANLKATQSQLIQSEKMASLGELTAGIAHEIQNPLNFMNNFSEVNKELLEEMTEELDNGNIEEAKIIANNIIVNEEKINHHGKRADEIVKGMLQHSRSGSGQKEPIDINTLCEEYLRLSYHGLRAKNKSFNASMKTYFDKTIGKINVVPQDIGRVILNLINNAFYAVSERFQEARHKDDFEPLVEISTKKLDDKIEIQVKDNGNGIPESIRKKIFQPFFTTKPAGQGTGLGLSLSYDIVKAHGGELLVETKSEVGTEFIIKLPLT